jgi:hypothetical protein
MLNVLCRCILKICVSISSLLCTCSIIFITSTVWASSTCVKLLPLSFVRTYEQSISVLGWCCPWRVNTFPALLVRSCVSSWRPLISSKLPLSIGTASHPVACFLFLALNFVFKISLLTYSFSLSFSFLCSIFLFPFTPKYLRYFVESGSLILFSTVLLPANFVTFQRNSDTFFLVNV